MISFKYITTSDTQLIERICYFLEDILCSEKLKQNPQFLSAIQKVLATQGNALIHVLVTAVSPSLFFFPEIFSPNSAILI